jgi:hypothetical protein
VKLGLDAALVVGVDWTTAGRQIPRPGMAPGMARGLLVDAPPIAVEDTPRCAHEVKNYPAAPLLRDRSVPGPSLVIVYQHSSWVGAGESESRLYYVYRPPHNTIAMRVHESTSVNPFQGKATCPQPVQSYLLGPNHSKFYKCTKAFIRPIPYQNGLIKALVYLQLYRIEFTVIRVKQVRLDWPFCIMHSTRDPTARPSQSQCRLCSNNSKRTPATRWIRSFVMHSYY